MSVYLDSHAKVDIVLHNMQRTQTIDRLDFLDNGVLIGQQRLPTTYDAPHTHWW